jgi:hypothetical protein
MVALNLCLLGVSISTEPKPERAAPVTKQSDSGNTVTFSPTLYPPTSATFKAAVILNLPALLVGGTVAMFLRHGGQTMDIAFGAIFAFPLWFRIGRWFDRQRAPEGPKALSPGRDTVRVVARIAVGLLLALSINGLTRAFHERTNETICFSLAYSLLCACYLACSFWGGWREKGRVIAA